MVCIMGFGDFGFFDNIFYIEYCLFFYICVVMSGLWVVFVIFCIVICFDGK